MRYSNDGFARFIGGAVKLSAPGATVGAMGATGEVTLANGQVFRFTVEELDLEEIAAETAKRYGVPGGAGDPAP